MDNDALHAMARDLNEQIDKAEQSLATMRRQREALDVLLGAPVQKVRRSGTGITKRIRDAIALFEGREFSVCEIAKQIGETSTFVSPFLSVLRFQGMLRIVRKEQSVRGRPLNIYRETRPELVFTEPR